MRHGDDSTSRLNLAGAAAVLLIGAGAILLAVFAGASLLLGIERNHGIERFEAARRSHANADRETPLGRADSPAARAAGETSAPGTTRAFAPDQALWSEARVAAYSAAASTNLIPEGVLRIPAVGIEVPVYTGTAELNLNRGAGRVEWTPPLGAPGNVGVAAHRDGFFRPLKDIETGDQIVVELLDRTLRYEVTGIAIVDPEAVEVLAPTPHSTLTLITCYPFYYVGSAPQRFIVQAALASGALTRN
jgi:sortase A